MNRNSNDKTVLACRLEAFNEEQRERYRSIRRQMSSAVEGVRELPDGYALRFPMEGSLFMTLAEFITLERLCCSFLNLGLEVAAENGPLWLRLTGGAGVKTFLRDEIGVSAWQRESGSR